MIRMIAALGLAGALLGAAGAALTQPIPAPSGPLFAPADPFALRSAVLPPEQNGTRRTRLAQLSELAEAALRAEALTLNLFEDAAFTAVGRARTGAARSNGIAIWTGRITGMSGTNVVLATDAAGNIDLRVLTLGRNFHAQSVGGGLVRISEIDPSAGRYTRAGMPINDAVVATPDEAERRQVEARMASPRADDGTIVDVLVVYTPAAVALLGSEAATRLAIETTAALTNVTYENSDVNFRLRLAHVAQVDYTQDGTNDLSRLRGTDDGHMDVVHQWRDEYNADLVALIAGTSVAERQYCGIANLPTVLPAPTLAFSITEALCISDITFAHELGHNMGKAHDHANGFSAVHPYAFGYQDQSEGPGDYGDWVTVMAYSTGGECPNSYLPGECPAIAYWSDNEATYLGKPLGSPGANGEDNQQSLNETALTIANYRISDDGGASIPTAVPTLTPIPTPGGNAGALVLNGSFELDNDANGVPDAWAWGATAGKRKCAGAAVGACAVKLAAGARIRQVLQHDGLALGEGDIVSLALWSKASYEAVCGAVRLKIRYEDPGAGQNADGRDLLRVPLPAAPTGTWNGGGGQIALDDGPEKLTLIVQASSGCPSALWIDGVDVGVAP